MKTRMVVAMVLSTSIVSAAWIQVGTGTGPAKVSVDRSSSLGATVTIEIPGIQAESVAINGAQYLKLTIPGAVSAGLGVGKPDVPAVPVLLARPTGSAVSLSILSIQTETLRMARVFPMQPPRELGAQAGPLVVDGSFYTSDVDYPGSRLSSPSLATWRDLDVVNVHVYPVVVRPAQHEVIVTSRITFRVDFSGGSYPRTVASWMPPLYQRLIQNCDDLKLTTAEQEPPGTKCLVFCDSEYVENLALDSLLSLMTMLGDKTELIRVGGEGHVPRDPYAIKDTIIARYFGLDSALRWAFLIGEYDEVPPRANYNAGYIVPYSDVWYTDLTYGYTDSCDGYPELGIARLSPEAGASGNNDLSNQIAKIIHYMMGRDTGDWPNTITLVAGVDTTHDPAPAVRIAATRELHFYPYDSLDGRRDTIMGYIPTISNVDVTNSVNNGTGVLIYLGHGDVDRWDKWNLADPPQSWRNEEVEDLVNRRTPVVFNVACHCGALNEQTCLSEQWMRTYDTSGTGMGAVASFGCSGTAFYPGADSQCNTAVIALGDYAYVDSTPHPGKYKAPVFDLGGIQMLMDAYIASNSAWDSTWDRANIYSFYWLGNPAMQVWSGGEPQTATVTYPSQIPLGNNPSFTVSVEIDGQDVEGAQVCVYKEDDFYAVGTTDDQGEVALDFTASSYGQFHVSASGGHERLNTPDVEHTPMLPYFGTAVVGVDSVMTWPNWGRKLVRDAGTDNLHVVYTARDSVFYTQSTDGGTTWRIVEPVGAGTSPAIILSGQGPVPLVVYLTPDSSIMGAFRNEGTPPSWDTATIFPSGPVSGKAGSPSLAAPAIQDLTPRGYVTYPVYADSHTNNFIYFNAFSPGSATLPETVDAAGTAQCYGASIAVTPLDLVHVAWARGESTYYSQRQYLVWSPPFQISSPTGQFITEPASNPSVEAYGDSVFCVWRGPNDNGTFPGDIWRRSRYLSWQPSVWADPSNQSKSESLESDYPVMTTSFATVWHEQVSPESVNTDVWGRFLPDLSPQPFFQTQLQSWYPHVDGYWTWREQTSVFICNTVRTEQLSLIPPVYAVIFGQHGWAGPTLGKGLGPDPRKDYEPASYYEAELGLPEQSPYCLSRGGFARFENWAVDTSETGLTYQLPYLDPRRTYKLRAVLYHEGDSTWSAQLRCDSGPWFQIKAGPRVPETVWVQVPKRMYNRDARIVVELARVTGGYASLAKLKLFQIEEQPGGDGGVQSTASVLRTRLLNCAPNPSSRMATVSYELGQAGPVELTIHDVCGRLVRRLESGYRSPGRYDVNWDATSDRGRRVPAGLYFLRFSANGQASSRRVTLIR